MMVATRQNLVALAIVIVAVLIADAASPAAAKRSFTPPCKPETGCTKCKAPFKLSPRNYGRSYTTTPVNACTKPLFWGGRWEYDFTWWIRAPKAAEGVTLFVETCGLNTDSGAKTALGIFSVSDDPVTCKLSRGVGREVKYDNGVGCDSSRGTKIYFTAKPGQLYAVVVYATTEICDNIVMKITVKPPLPPLPRPRRCKAEDGCTSCAAPFDLEAAVAQPFVTASFNPCTMYNWILYAGYYGEVECSTRAWWFKATSRDMDVSVATCSSDFNHKLKIWEAYMDPEYGSGDPPVPLCPFPDVYPYELHEIDSGNFPASEECSDGLTFTAEAGRIYVALVSGDPCDSCGNFQFRFSATPLVDK